MSKTSLFLFDHKFYSHNSSESILIKKWAHIFRWSIVVQLFILIGYSVLQSQWITPTPQGNRLVSSVTIEGKAYFLGESSALIMTDDGGDNWQLLSPYVSPIERFVFGDTKNQFVAFTDSLHGFITASYVPYKTSDGGHHWIQSQLPVGYGPILFSSPKYGWKGGWSGYYRTTNGGTSWISMPAHDTTDNYITEFAASDSMHVWLLTSIYPNEDSSSIKYSSNSGISWMQQTINWGIYSDSANRFGMIDIKVNSSGIGLVCGSAWLYNQTNPLGFVLRTTNFGNTWKVIQLFPGRIYNSILSVNDSLWILLGNNPYSQTRGLCYEPSIIRSSDSGKTWTTVFQSLELPAPQTGVYIPSKNVLIAGGWYGIMYRSKNLGETWEIIGKRNPRLRDIDFHLGTEYGIAVGDSSFVLSSFDNGRTWHPSRIDSLQHPNLICVTARKNKTWVGGEKGILFLSTNKGIDWERRRISYDTILYYNYNIKDISAYDDNCTALVFSDDGFINDKTFIYYTSDGGNHWGTSEFPEGIQAWSIQMQSEKKIVAGGIYFPLGGFSGEGFVAYTKDFGQHWDTTHLPHPVVKVAMLNDSVGFAGTYGGVFRTRNRWQTWQKVFQDYYEVPEIVFDRNGVGWMLHNYDLLTSTDEGENWEATSLQILSEKQVKSMSFDSSGTMYFVMDDGAFLSSGKSLITGISSNNFSNSILERKNEFTLSQNYPNPFNPTTNFRFRISDFGFITLKIYNVLGEEVATLLNNEAMENGEHEIAFDASNLTSGIYFYRLSVTEQGTVRYNETKKLVVVK